MGKSGLILTPGMEDMWLFQDLMNQMIWSIKSQ